MAGGRLGLIQWIPALWSKIPGVVKWGVGGTAAVAGAAGTVNAAMGGHAAKDAAKWAANGPLEVGAETSAHAAVDHTKTFLTEMLQLFAIIAEALGMKGAGSVLRNISTNIDSKKTTNHGGNATPVGGFDGPNGGDPNDPNQGHGGPGLLGPALGAVGLGGAGYLGYNAWKNRAPEMKFGSGKFRSVAEGAHRSLTAEELAAAAKGVEGMGAKSGLFAKAEGFLSKLGRPGKIAAGVLAVGAAGAVALSGSDAEAATPSSGALRNATTVGAGVGSLQSGVAEVGGMGLSIVASKAAATGLVEVAAPLLAQLGVKAIPGVASIYAAGEGIYNTSKYALRGEWGKAGLSLVSGVGETVAGLGGAVTYLTVGTAWREAVRGVGAMAFGEENTIDHSAPVQLASWLKNQFTNASNGTEAAAPVATRDRGFSFSPAGMQPALAM